MRTFFMFAPVNANRNISLAACNFAWGKKWNATAQKAEEEKWIKAESEKWQRDRKTAKEGRTWKWKMKPQEKERLCVTTDTNLF